MKASSLTIVAGAVLIGAGGFLAGRISSSYERSAIHPDMDSGTMTGSRTHPGTGQANVSDGLQPGSSRKSARVRPDAATPTPFRSEEEKNTALRTLVLGEDPLERNRALLDWISRLSPSELAKAVDDFRKLGVTENRMGEYGILLAAWAKVDPLAALAYAKDETGGMFATHTILSTWASKDPDAAIRWANEHHQGEGANPYMAGIIRGIAASDPQKATSLLTSMPRSQERGEALDAILPHILSQGRDSAFGWISGLGEEVLRNGALMRSVDSLAKLDPNATLALLMATPGEARERRMDDLYSSWAGKDRDQALQSATTIQDANMRANAIRGVITAAAIENPQQALSLMDQHSADLTDRTVQSFVWHTFWKDPAVAVQQIARIGDQGQREQMYRRMVGEWIDRDQAGALAWVQNNPLPQPVMDQINLRLQKRN